LIISAGIDRLGVGVILTHGLKEAVAMPFMEECMDWPLSQVLPILQRRIMEGSTYHGIPTLKNPLDFWVYQEILWDTRPEVIIEIGNFHGGSTFALAHACDALDRGRVIGIDTNHDRVPPQVKAHPRITLLTGEASSMYPVVERLLGRNTKVMVIEDSAHDYESTLKILETYAPIVGTNQYLIVEDGICHHGLDIGPSPGPYEAVEAFLQNNKSFAADRSKEAYGITWNPKGYLKKT
jgi:cephalosporin hydroxylase